MAAVIIIMGLIIFLLMGIPFFIGILLRLLFPRTTSFRVALLAAVLVVLAELPRTLVSDRALILGGFSPLAINTSSRIAAGIIDICIWHY